VDDMIVVRGVNIYPSAVESVLRGFPQVIEFRVVHLTSCATPGLRVEVELDSGETDVAGKVAEIGGALRTALSIRVPVAPVSPGSLPRFDMKASRWAREPRLTPDAGGVGEPGSVGGDRETP
jgi:phenylacetate-CoA ligase